MSSPTIVLVGNPNVGKTSLFNALAKRNERVGNYPGVTVERRSAEILLPSGDSAELVDVPGAYSLSSRSGEEQTALHAVLGMEGNPTPDLAIVVVDAGQLTRNLYLVLQLIELQVPIVVALNMLDEAGAAAPDPDLLSEQLSAPCVPVNARLGQGLLELGRAVERRLASPAKGLPLRVQYGSAVNRVADLVASALPEAWCRNVERDRALALWALASIDEDDEMIGIPEGLRARCLEVGRRFEGEDLDAEIIAPRYELLDKVVACSTGNKVESAVRHASLTERLDRFFLHPTLGFVVFGLLMTCVFQALFAWSDPAIGLVEWFFGQLQQVAVSQLPPGLLRELIVEGLVGGVGNVVVFLPQILLLFFFVGMLEDSGYMARVAYLMDRPLRAVGLHGRAFVPMMSGFACAVPAILATRTMERRRDQLLTMLVVPLMSCSARLPVYTLIIAALFPPRDLFGVVPVQGLLMVAMYVFSTCIALLAAAVLGRTVVRGRSVPLILELPPYRLPGVATVVRMVSQRGRTFLREAGTTILAFTVVMWVLLSFPRTEVEVLESSSRTAVAAQEGNEESGPPSIENSYGGRLGKVLEPVLEPLGFDWKIGIGIVGAFAAREVFVSTLAMVYGVEGDADEDIGPLRNRIRSETTATGEPAYTPLMGLSLMVFFALACQCMSTLAVVRRETAGWGWPLFLFGYMTALAYCSSLVVFQVGRAIGF